MILQSLEEYYEVLAQQGKLAPPGWDSSTKVSFGLELSEDGTLEDIIDFREKQVRGKKEVFTPQLMTFPEHDGRSSGIHPYFLCDNSSYMLGIDAKGKPERSRKCFEASKALHEELLVNATSKAASAIKGFFNKWDPTYATDNPIVATRLEELVDNANIVFCFGMIPVNDDDEIKQTWEKYYSKAKPDDVIGQCLVTGEIAPIARTHHPIMGIQGAQSSGAALVSFNSPSFCSYGKDQNLNAPVSEKASFSYTSALNALIADREHRQTIGDTTVIFWSQNGDHCYQDALMAALYGGSDKITDHDLASLFSKASKGYPIDWSDTRLSPEERFYILGISPNAARLSVRFFYQNSFGNILNNIRKHYHDIEIVKPFFDVDEYIPLWKLLSETINPNSKDKKAGPQLAGDVLRSILTGVPYPATLLNTVELRIRAEHKVNRGKAAIIKAYYLRNQSIQFPREVLKMNGDSNSTNIPYTLGRLFAVYEQIQESANPNLNATITDKYFNSASGTPGVIFPRLGNLAQKHLRVIRRSKPGLAINLDKKLGELTVIIGDTYPSRLTLPEQGAFQLGYYFEKQQRYAKKDK